MESFEWLAITHYPAETRLFESVDTSFVTFVSQRKEGCAFSPTFIRVHRKLNVLSEETIHISATEFRTFIVRHSGTVVRQRYPSSRGRGRTCRCLHSSKMLVTRDYGSVASSMKLGRHRFTQSTGSIPFVKGRLVSRYRLSEEMTEYIKPDVGATAAVQRASSSGVARTCLDEVSADECTPQSYLRVDYAAKFFMRRYFRDDNLDRLNALLAILNSYCFEAQVNARLGTGHISLGMVKETHIPLLDQELIGQLAVVTKRARLEIFRRGPSRGIGCEGLWTRSRWLCGNPCSVFCERGRTPKTDGRSQLEQASKKRNRVLAKQASPITCPLG